MELFKNKSLSYDEWWNFISENKDLRWKIIAAGGNYGMFERYAPSYYFYKIEDISDENYKRLYFSSYEERDAEIVRAGGFPMDNWPHAKYDIRVHNLEPLEIFIDWYDEDEDMRGIYIFRVET